MVDLRKMVDRWRFIPGSVHHFVANAPKGPVRTTPVTIITKKDDQIFDSSFLVSGQDVSIKSKEKRLDVRVMRTRLIFGLAESNLGPGSPWITIPGHEDVQVKKASLKSALDHFST